MKAFFPILIIAVISCCSSKKTTTRTTTVSDTSMITNNTVRLESDSVPACIKKLITQFKQEDKQNPPRSIYSYTYNDKLVFFVPAICCDFFSDLYDADCNLIGHPDGGYTGRGDGKTTDFIKTRTNEKLIWKDERK